MSSTKRKRRITAWSSVAIIGGIIFMLAMPGGAEPLPGGLGPCIPGVLPCPDTDTEPGSGPIVGNDNNVNIYVGGGYTTGGAAAEAEGKIVVLGDFTQNRATGGSIYNVGVVGVGSRVPPDPGSDYLTVGGDVTVTAGKSLAADGGVVAYGGTATGTITPSSRKDPGAINPYIGLRGSLETASHCYADPAIAPATGTMALEFGTATFTGDGISMLQVFNLDQDVAGSGGSQVFVDFVGIPAGATVLINLTKSGALTVAVNNGSAAWHTLRRNILWNVPNASSVSFEGTAQFQGSILVGNPASLTTVSMPGLNGRFFTTGDLLHTGTSGAEFHAYPFEGNLPACVKPTPSATLSPSPTATPSPTPTSTASPAPSVVPTIDPSPDPSNTFSPAPTTPSAGGGGLAMTGANIAWLALAALVLLALGTGLVALACIRTR